jgi:hypothetical protein
MIVGIKSLAAINLLGAVISLVLLASTWFGQGIIVREARQFALHKTRTYLEAVIPKVEKLVGNPLVAKTLPPSVKEKLNRELAEYRESPEEWLLEIAEGASDRARDFEFPEVWNPLARTALDFIVKQMAQAREHFKKSLSNLIRDLRIFAITNSSAFLIAGWLSLVARTRQMRCWLGAWSVALFVATLLASFIYVGQSWLWNILTNSYYGWTYAATHLVITFCLIIKILPTPEAEVPMDDQ